jgi:hypothetical protein
VGILFNFLDENNYSKVSFRNMTGKLCPEAWSLSKVAGGNETFLVSHSRLTLNPSALNRVAVETVDNGIQVYLNGVRLFNGTDNNMWSGATTGLQSVNLVAAFDNLCVSTLPRTQRPSIFGCCGQPLAKANPSAPAPIALASVIQVSRGNAGDVALLVLTGVGLAMAARRHPATKPQIHNIRYFNLQHNTTPSLNR